MHLDAQQWRSDRAALRIGGACAVIGSLVVVVFRLAHGDPPAGDPNATLRFIAGNPAYGAIHVATILGVLVWVAGFVALSSTFTQPSSRLLGMLGRACVLAGTAVFALEFSIDGIAGQDLARAWATAPAGDQASLVLALHVADTMLRGPSLVAIVILWGLPLLLFGRAVTLEGYPAWTGWTGLAIGATTILGAIALLLQPDLFPGVVVYGLLASIVVQVWSVALGITVWRRAVAISDHTGPALQEHAAPALPHARGW